MKKSEVTNKLLNANLSLAASPTIHFLKPGNVKMSVPDGKASIVPGEFTVNLDTTIEYASLNPILNGYLTNKRFEISEGFIKKHLIVKSCELSGGANNTLLVAVVFTGSHNGTVYFTGKPYYNNSTKQIEWTEFDYDLKSNDFLLNAAKWLFDKKIVSQIRKYTTINLSAYYATTAASVNNLLNKEWTKGVQGAGKVSDITVTEIFSQHEHLILRCKCTGTLQITIREMAFNF